MQIKELTTQSFKLYCENSPLQNYMQSEEYARTMGENHFNYDYIGLVDDSGVIHAASLILIKRIGMGIKYGYAPKGFLINYYDENLVRTFIKLLQEYYIKKGISFIKINPEIVVGEINAKTLEYKTNPNIKLKTTLPEYGFKHLRDNLYFESIEPRYNAYIDLKNTNNKLYSKANRNKVRNSKRKGLYLELGKKEDLDSFIKMANLEKSKFYKNLYNFFRASYSIDLLLVRVDYEKYIKNSQELYEKEERNNSLYNEILHRSHSQVDLNKKMQSDALLTTLKNEIVSATEGLSTKNNTIVAAALVIKYNNRVHIVESAYDKSYANLNANYFLYDQIIENYKYDYDYLDIGGITGDFKDTNPYHGLNRFKMGFNPIVYEYIGEYDLIINKNSYELMRTSGRLAQEFNKKDI